MDRSDVLEMVGRMLSGRLANASLEPVVGDRELVQLVDRAVLAVEAVDARLRVRKGGGR